ncbi:MAG: cytochrome c biogenesis protein CcsA [Planctomycetota bacterium]|nr:cytochrome c biogenesis protein CcsA [Planctomycetota bacterium]
MRLGHRLWLVFLGALLLAPPSLANEDRVPSMPQDVVLPRTWSDDALTTASHIPVQDGGRLKPLSTVAAFSLLRMNHKRSLRDSDGNKVTSLEWLLNVLYYPDAARREPVFLIPDSAVLDALGLKHEGKKRRDRYSYDDLLPAREKLFRLGHEYGRIDGKDRTVVQGQIVDLVGAFDEFEGYAHYLDFARRDVILEQVEGLAPYFGGKPGVRVSEALYRFPEILRDASGEGKQAEALRPAANFLFEQLKRRLHNCYALALFPPLSGDEWMTARDLLSWSQDGQALPAGHLKMLRDLEDTLRRRDDAAAFRAGLKRFQESGSGAARTRGAYDKIELEVRYYRLDPFHHSLLLYLGAFLLVAFSWLKAGKWLLRSVYLLLGSGLALHAIGITLRCILRGRPPVSTLYETILFITSIGVLASLVIEIINRRRIALATASILGVVGLFVANRYELMDKVDTMPQLVAVLDTNFWLATHVTCITIGYAAGLLAAAIAHVHVIGRAVGFKRDDPAFYRNIVRMVYGVICFALLFSVVGTILGGVWANESWGRFWGWDPKENGALLIVLSQLALLHARMGGYIKGHGICMSAILVGGVVAFSWWGVNLLGIGLHSYGFTHGPMKGLMIFAGVESTVLLAGLVSWWRTPTAPVAS